MRVEVAVAPDDLDRAPLHESRVASGGVPALRGPRPLEGPRPILAGDVEVAPCGEVVAHALGEGLRLRRGALTRLRLVQIVGGWIALVPAVVGVVVEDLPTQPFTKPGIAQIGALAVERDELAGDLPQQRRILRVVWRVAPVSH